MVEDATFVADSLWDEWGNDIEGSSIDNNRFIEIARGYSGDLRLWIVGERPWDHCVASLAGRVLRRLPSPAAGVGFPEVNR